SSCELLTHTQMLTNPHTLTLSLSHTHPHTHPHTHTQTHTHSHTHTRTQRDAHPVRRPLFSKLSLFSQFPQSISCQPCNPCFQPLPPLSSPPHALCPPCLSLFLSLSLSPPLLLLSSAHPLAPRRC